MQLDSTHHSLALFAGHSSAYNCFGRLFFAFIRGWEDQEKIKAYHLVQTIAKSVYSNIIGGEHSEPHTGRSDRKFHKNSILSCAFVFVWLVARQINVHGQNICTCTMLMC